jgi:hypothetical protein
LFVGQGLDLRDNSAFRNGQHGIEIITGTLTGRIPRKIRIRNNTALGHEAPSFDLTEDDDQCRGVIWQKNIFDRRSPACIK